MRVDYNKKLIFVVSSPSGAGKTSVCQKLIERDKRIALSISDTTRPARDNEKNGIDYNFIEESEFKKRIKNNAYIEYANVFGNFYGSQHQNIINNFQNNMDILFDIDWQGAEQLKKSSYSNIVSIFIIPPSKKVIYQRLKSRAEKSGDDDKAINNRMKEYETEMSHKIDYDYIVVNDKLEKCVREIELIIKHHRKN
jgi:guanylate kinase|tara:strand:+ start:417 stop:1004 length:588 start_codon:yes stop_codon:yes gene_type:complete